MEAAKLAVAEFTSKRGHTTDVEEVVRPAITLETIKPSRHEIVTEAIDKEVHRHHYHTTIQPISHKEVLPTKHSHNLLAIAKRDFIHKTKDINLKVKDAHTKELALFANRTETLPTTHTKANLPVVVGEHIHHHVHEVVQPIIFKETIVPEVVHTTIPIHEVHHREAIHHHMSELGMLTLEAFMARQKTHNTTMHETYEGAPRPYNSKLNVVDPLKFRHKPAPINTTAARNSTSTPPLSPASASSSSMPSTPKSHNAHEPGFRHSEDSMDGFSLPNSPMTKSPKAHQIPTGQIRTPQQVRI